MAPQVGFEPTTDRLTADSSTTESIKHKYYYINLVEFFKSYIKKIYGTFTLI
ncbi:MAG: hypothetical protein E6755_12845 [Staphylococcus epidermidis]|nr:hypothetical protein [Staphylococcus epidermidis]